MLHILRNSFLPLLLCLPRHIDCVVGTQLDPVTCSGEETVTSGTVLSSNYSQLLVCGNWSRIISISDGYQVDLTVNSLHIGPDDYLAISSGSTRGPILSTAILVGKIHAAKRLRAVRSRTVHIQFVTLNTSKLNLEGFSITFSTDRPLTTTHEPTVPSSTLPTAPAKVPDTYTIYLRGRKAVDFLQYREGLQTSISEMAQRYCKDNNITTLQNITEQNVVFRYVERCDVTWPQSTECTKVQLAVPVVVSSGYQLTANAIKDMWDNYATVSQRLSLIGLQVYTAPDPQMSMLVWLSLLLVITAIFSISILLIRWQLNNKSRSKRRVTDSQTRLSSASKRSWIDDLPHQELPVNAVAGIREFEPDSMHMWAPLASSPPRARPHVPIPDSKPLPPYGATLLFGHGFDKQVLIEKDEGPESNVSVS